MGDQPTVVLIDSSSSHNFVDPNFIQRAGIQLVLGNCFQVVVGGRIKLPCTYHCSRVKLRLGLHEFKGDYYVLGLGGHDIVLGVEWLQTLGRVTWDFGDRTISYADNGVQH